jgi:hypothetical protein
MLPTAVATNEGSDPDFPVFAMLNFQGMIEHSDVQ